MSGGLGAITRRLESKLTNACAYRYGVISRRDAAVRLDIPLEMAHRNGILARLSEAELEELDRNPPPWLAQSRANRTGKRPVWVHLTCEVCGATEAARPKKWWPEFTHVMCAHHFADELPSPASGLDRHEFDGVGSHFIGVVDSPRGA